MNSEATARGQHIYGKRGIVGSAPGLFAAVSYHSPHYHSTSCALLRLLFAGAEQEIHAGVLGDLRHARCAAGNHLGSSWATWTGRESKTTARAAAPSPLECEQPCVSRGKSGTRRALKAPARTRRALTCCPYCGVARDQRVAEDPLRPCLQCKALAHGRKEEGAQGRDACSLFFV